MTLGFLRRHTSLVVSAKARLARLLIDELFDAFLASVVIEGIRRLLCAYQEILGIVVGQSGGR